MLRVIFSIIGGYVVMTVVAAVLFYLAIQVMGPERIIGAAPEEATLTWLFLSLFLMGVTGAAGGKTAYAIAERKEGVYLLAILVVLLGYLGGGGETAAETGRVDLLSMVLYSGLQAVNYPDWYEWFRPVIAGVFVLYAGQPTRLYFGTGT